MSSFYLRAFRIFWMGILAGAVGTVQPTTAAPPPRYGGTLVATTMRSGLPKNPWQIAGPADATLAAAVFEPLFTADDEGEPVPVLAETRLRYEGRSAILTIRPNVRRHDGKELDGKDVVAWLNDLARPGHPAGHLVLPLKGGRERQQGQRLPLGAVASGRYTVQLELAHPYPYLEALWALPAAGVAVGPEGVGTGPFLPNLPARLVPFVHHRAGRPYLDALDVRIVRSRFTVENMARRHETLVFDATRSACKQAEAYLVLAVGKVAQRAFLRRALDYAVDRDRLVRLVLPRGSQAARSFMYGTLTSPPGPPKKWPKLKLLAAANLPGGEALSKNVQFDLLGTVPTTIHERSGVSWPQAPKDSLVLDRVTLPVGANTSVDRFHALMALAARFGRAPAVSASRLESFVQTPEDQRDELLDKFEAEVREALQLVPLARFPVGPALPKGLRGARLGPGCAVELANARFAGPPP